MQSTEWTEGTLNLYSEAELLCLSKILQSLNQDAQKSLRKGKLLGMTHQKEAPFSDHLEYVTADHTTAVYID